MSNSMRINRLQRRADWLAGSDGDYDLAERSALLWAIPILRKHVHDQAVLAERARKTP